MARLLRLAAYNCLQATAPYRLQDISQEFCKTDAVMLVGTKLRRQRGSKKMEVTRHIQAEHLELRWPWAPGTFSNGSCGGLHLSKEQEVLCKPACCYLDPSSLAGWQGWRGGAQGLCQRRYGIPLLAAEA